MVIYDAFDKKNANYENWTKIADLHVIIARFICGMVLHMSFQGELAHAIVMMKYALNHWWKFKSYHQAFLAGLL